MKKLLILIALSVFILFSLISCGVNETPKEIFREIPVNNISFTGFTTGNVIQDGKQAIFFNFVSDYTVTKIEIEGTLLDKDGKAIHSFDTLMTLSNPSYNPELAIRIEKDIINNVKSVSFTKITAYTLQNINKSNSPVLRHIVTANKSTVESFYAFGSTMITTNGKITFDLKEGTNCCGLRWDLSEVNLNSNTKYLIKLENVSIAEMKNNSVQLNMKWVDSTYTWPRYYHVKGERFDIISSGSAISNDYYQFLKSKTYDSYTMEFSFSHSGVEDVTAKSLYFDFWGVENRLIIGKLSIYEITYD